MDQLKDSLPEWLRSLPLAQQFTALGGSHSLVSVLNDPAVERIARSTSWVYHHPYTTTTLPSYSSIGGSRLDEQNDGIGGNGTAGGTGSATEALNEAEDACLKALASFHWTQKSDADTGTATSEWLPRSRSDGVDMQIPLQRTASLHHALACVPSVFFERSLTLSDPATFRRVIDDAGTDSTEGVTERLGVHVDTVETCLLAEISNRASEFPDALNGVRTVSTHIDSLTHLASYSRQQLHRADAILAAHTMHVQLLQRRKQNLQSLKSACESLHSACIARDTAATLASASDFLGALDAADEAEKHLNEVVIGSHFELDCLHCSMSLVSSIEEAREHAASKALANLLTAAMSADDVDRIAAKASSCLASNGSATPERVRSQRSHGREAVVSKEQEAAQNTIGHELQNAIFQYETSATEVDRNCMQATLLALGRAGKLSEGLHGYHDALAERLKSLFSECLNRIVPELMRRSTEGKQGGPSNEAASHDSNDRNAGATSAQVQPADDTASVGRLKDGPPNAEHALSSSLYHDFEMTVRTIAQALLQELRVASTAAECINATCVSQQYHLAGATALVVAPAVDLVQTRIAQALSCRKENVDSYAEAGSFHHRQLAEFIRWYIAELESLSGWRCSLLRSALYAHAKGCLHKMHLRCQDSLSAQVEQEKWVPVDVEPEFQRCVDALLAQPAATEQDEPSVNEHDRSSEPNVAAAGKDSAASSQRNGDAVEAGPALLVTINGKDIACVSSVQALIRMLEEYRMFAQSLPEVAAEVTSKVSELVRLFNSRTCQLVLGGGASKTSGIKSITAKTVACADQAVVLLLEVLPAMRKHLAAYQPAEYEGLIAVSLDKAIGDLRAHLEEMHTRFESLARSRASHHLSKLHKQAEDSWMQGASSVKPEDEQIASGYNPSNYTTQLVKEVATLARALRPLLQQDEKQAVFEAVATAVDSEAASQLSNTIATCYSSQFVCVQVRTDAAVLAAEVPYSLDKHGKCTHLTAIAHANASRSN